jgi:hypothetical protein
MGWGTVTTVEERNARGSAEEPRLSLVSTSRENCQGHSRSGISSVPRPQQVWQRRSAEVRTDPSRPETTGLPLTGMCWFNSQPRRCHSSLQALFCNLTESTGNLAAAQEPSVISFLDSPKILSAFHRQSRRQDTPDLILSGGEPCWHRTSLRPMRTSSPRLDNQPSFRRTHTALPGATGVDSKTGAAIHEPVVPGELE